MQHKKNGGSEDPPRKVRCEKSLRPARGAGACPTLVVAVAAVNRLTADWCERHLSRDSAAITRHTHHRALTSAATVSVACSLTFVAAVLAALRLVRESTL